MANAELTRRPLRVLIIEDDRAEARILEEMLYEAGGQFNIARHARTLGDGLATDGAVDVVLLDLSLPDGEGLETFTRASAAFDNLPIIVISGHDDEAMSVRTVVEGAQDYLVKGRFDHWGLARSVRHAFERHRLEARRREAEEALRHSEERYRHLFEDDPTGLVVAAEDGRILDCNPAFIDMFGFHSGTGRDFSLRDLFPDSLIDDLLDRLGHEQRTEGLELHGRRLDGTKIIVAGNAAASFDDRGQLSGLRAYLIDETDRMKTEEQLLQAQKMEAVGRLAGGVAHDFSNIVTAISFHAETLLASLPPDGPLAKRAQNIRDAAQQAASLTTQLLAFSRKQVMRTKVLDLNLVVRNMRALYTHFIGEDILVEIDLATDLGRVEADLSQLEQVLLNLIVNARDAMPRGGRLSLSTTAVELTDEHMAAGEVMRRGRYALLTVRDTGVGMDAYTRRRIFEPFFTTKERGSGSGLGLSTVYGIVQQSKGYISVDSSPGSGTTFSVYLPRVEGGAEEERPTAFIEASAGTGDETVLVVEDDDALRSLMLEALEAKGYRGLEASTCAEALALAEARGPSIDLLIIDVVMPDMRGTDLAARFQDRWPAMKVLLISGYGDSMHFAERSDSYPFLEKPFNSLILIRKARAVLDD